MGREVKTWRKTNMVVSFLILFFTLSPGFDSRVGQVTELWTRTKTREALRSSLGTREIDSHELQSVKRIAPSPPPPLFFSPSPTLKPVAAELPLCQWWWRYKHMKVPGNNLSLPEELKQGPLWSGVWGKSNYIFSSLFCFTLWAAQAMQTIWQCEKLKL